MKPVAIREIADKIGAAYSGPADAAVSDISTDTRSLLPGCLFIALSGENFDGNNYVGQALAQGASFAVAQRIPQGVPPQQVLLVPDTRKALLQIANLYRNLLDVQVIGITGSVGKTTTKEMVACVAQAAFKTWKTPLNLNNEIGLSQTILSLEEAHQVAVLEMGMDGPGQMAPLSRCAQPDIAILTNVGVSHIEQFESREGIMREKLDIVAGMGQQGTLIINNDNELLKHAELPANKKLLRYGLEKGGDVCADHIKEYSTHTTFEILYDKKRFDAQIPCLGRHNVYNALAAFLAGVALGIEPRIAIAALKNYRPAGMRQNVVPHGEFTVVEDCYNASPDSMLAALETLGGLACSGKRIAVFSDMLELGQLAEQAHLDIGRSAAHSKIDMLLCTGPLSVAYVQGAQEAGMMDAWYFKSQDALFQRLKELLQPGDVVWFKASRGMKLEQVIEKVYKEC